MVYAYATPPFCGFHLHSHQLYVVLHMHTRDAYEWLVLLVACFLCSIISTLFKHFYCAAYLCVSALQVRVTDMCAAARSKVDRDSDRSNEQSIQRYRKANAIYIYMSNHFAGVDNYLASVMLLMVWSHVHKLNNMSWCEDTHKTQQHV